MKVFAKVLRDACSVGLGLLRCDKFKSAAIRVDRQIEGQARISQCESLAELYPVHETLKVCSKGVHDVFLVSCF